jgi:hypothetical protein
MKRDDMKALLAESARIIIAISKYAAEAPIDQVNIEAPGAVMNQPRTVAEVKRVVLPIMHLPDDTDLCSGAAYEAMLAARTTLNGVLADVWKNAEGKELEAILKISRKSRDERCQQRRKGWTGSFETPVETWETMRAASLAGENLRSLSGRFRVLYWPVLRQRKMDCPDGVLWGMQRMSVPSTNMIEFPRRTRP